MNESIPEIIYNPLKRLIISNDCLTHLVKKSRNYKRKVKKIKIFTKRERKKKLLLN